MDVCADGCSYGDVVVQKDLVNMASLDGRNILNFKLENISQCVVPANNRDEVEIHFHDDDKIGRDEDAMVQVTFHFPFEENEDEEVEEETKAEEFKKTIIDSGIMKAATGNVIVEFTKDQGNFVTPKGKYSIQMLATAMHMQGAQYLYKIKYEDIQSLFLLPKPDGGRMAFIISLEKPIRQGNQKYQHLIIETHKIETTVTLNLTDEEINEKYAGQLTKEITAPMSTLFAKIFKVLSQTTVFVPKHFVSSRETNAIRCSLKANDGLLYPLAKSFIFIHKPTVIIKFEDVESIEFQRYDPTVASGARNFDLVVSIKQSSAYEAREYSFASIDRAEFSALHDFLNARNLNIVKIVSQKANLDLGDDGDEGDEDESEDDDYVGGDNEDGDDDDDDSDAGSSDDDAATADNKKKRKADSGGKEKKKAAKGDDDEDD